MAFMGGLAYSARGEVVLQNAKQVFGRIRRVTLTVRFDLHKNSKVPIHDPSFLRSRASLCSQAIVPLVLSYPI